MGDGMTCAIQTQIPTTGLKAWVTRLLEQGGPQIKKVAYGLVVLASIAWLSIDLRHGISTNWIAVYAILTSAVSTGYLVGKKIGLAGSVSPGGVSPGIEPGGCARAEKAGGDS